MSLFSDLKSLLGSNVFESSHQRHLKNLEKKGIKVLEIVHEGTSSTMVELPIEYNNQLEAFAKKVAYPKTVVGNRLIESLSPLVYQIVLWGIRDLQFYDEFSGSEKTFEKLEFTLSEREVRADITLSGFTYSVTYTDAGFKVSPFNLVYYVLPFEDINLYRGILSTNKHLLSKGTTKIVWDEFKVDILTTPSKSSDYYKGRYYIYSASRGVFSSVNGQNEFLPYEREDWSNLLNYGYHFDSEDAAKSFLDSDLKPFLKGIGETTGDLQLLSSARVYSEVLKLQEEN